MKILLKILLYYFPENELFQDAYAYLTDPDARLVSRYTYPSGNPMSVRAAKRQDF